MPAKGDEDSRDVAYVRLNKAHWQLSCLGVGMFGVMFFSIAAVDPSVDIGVLGLLIFMLTILIIGFPFNSYITWWKADTEGFRFKNILKNVFIPANDVRQIGIINIYASGTVLFIQGSKKSIGVPIKEDGVSEFMDFVMKNYPESVWFTGKDFMVRYIETRKNREPLMTKGPGLLRP
ncbi:MAG: hypothetical protein SA339_07005 [Methanomassiliicoccus sp.]|nr:hypothetical protein [Methanomassiliicoccus sp.]